MEKLRLVAEIIRYVYHNDENSYSIIRAKDENGKEITLVGYVPLLSSEILYEFLGTYTNHDKYGEQFQVVSYKKSETQTKEGLVSYLSSQFFTGIGTVTAKKIVDKFGENAISIILKDKNVLKKLNFKDDKIEQFYNELLENQINEHILITLYSYNISLKVATKILNAYGILTLDKLEKNPYQLIKDIEGIGFIKADEIAMNMNIKKDDERRISAAIIYSFDLYTFQSGNMYLDSTELNRYTKNILNTDTDITPYLEKLILNNELVKEDDRYYLLSGYQAEVRVSDDLKRLLGNNTYNTDREYIESILDMVQIQKNIEYTSLQKEAMIESIINKVTVITGGPGTGKTTIIDGIIDLYANIKKIKLTSDSINDKIALMAPTGRAAKRMEDVLGLEAKTIHRHLGYGYDGIFAYDEYSQMPHDLIIIDESSMIDIFLAKRLFQSIKDDAQVIIVGDVDQLPSVSPGMVLKDIIESKIVPVLRLTEIHRQAKNSDIIKLANLVNKQELDFDNITTGNDLFILKANNNEKIKETIVKQIKGALNKGYDIINDIQVLIPTYKGDIGIDSVNALLQETFNDNPDNFLTYGDKKYIENDKIIQLVNDPKNFVMNGDIGYIKRISKTTDNKDFLVLNFLGTEVIYDKQNLEDVNLAYAMSVHKSQGSEYKIVILPLVRQYMHMLKKELLYTAITRAKNFLIILGDIDLLAYAANNLSEQRKTTLKMRLEK